MCNKKLKKRDIKVTYLLYISDNKLKFSLICFQVCKFVCEQIYAKNTPSNYENYQKPRALEFPWNLMSFRA